MVSLLPQTLLIRQYYFHKHGLLYFHHVSQHTRVNLMATCTLFQILAKLGEQLHGPGTVLNYLTYVTSFNSHKTMWRW